MQTVWTTLADRVRWLLSDLKTRGVDQRAFGEEAQLSDGYISNFLTRAKKNPKATINADAAAAICVRWKVSPAWILLNIGSPYDAMPSSTTATRFRDSRNWTPTATQARANDPALPAWAFDVVGDWPAPPNSVTLSAGLVEDLVRIVARYYPTPEQAVIPPSATPTQKTGTSDR